MKIAHIVCRYPPYYGGMGNVVFQTASGLTRRGHTVEVFTPQFNEPLEEEVAFARRLKPAVSYRNAAWLPSLKKELADFDVVHLHYPFFGTANIVRRWKLQHPDKPLIVTYHMDNRAQGWLGLFFKYYAAYWLPKILQSADAGIASSFDYLAASDARHVYKKNPEKWHELPFGVDTERFQPRPKNLELFSELELNPDTPTLLFVGGMDPAHHFKGIPVLLRACAQIKKSGLLVQTILVGDGALRAEFETQARHLGLSDCVRFVGHVSENDLPFWYNLADLLVLPSTTKGEAFGMVLLEAMASGVPVVASDLAGVRTVAADGGILVEPNNVYDLAEAIYGYFAEGNDRVDWGARVRKIAVEKYAWDPLLEKLEGIYVEAVENLKSKF